MQAPTDILVPLSGIVKNVSGGTLTILEGASSTIQVAASGSTAIVREGTLKDAATYQADLQNFHQESDQLMQDPQKNQFALETLLAPSRYIETPISLSQISISEQIIAFADGRSSNGAYEAVRIEVTPAP